MLSDTVVVYVKTIVIVVIIIICLIPGKLKMTIPSKVYPCFLIFLKIAYAEFCISGIS